MMLNRSPTTISVIQSTRIEVYACWDTGSLREWSAPSMMRWVRE
jgi:hypothetical protein